MAIQFRCSNCSQPIEVDDEYAGKAAACPYCKCTVTVPESSTYSPADAAAARPVAPPPMPGAASTPSFPESPAIPGPPPHHRLARQFGTYGLICIFLGVVLYGISTARAVHLLSQLGVFAGSAPWTTQDMKVYQQQVGSDQLVVGLGCGAMFFILAGSVFSLVCFIQNRRDWRGIVGLSIVVLGLCCVSSAVLIQFVMGA